MRSLTWRPRHGTPFAPRTAPLAPCPGEGEGKRRRSERLHLPTSAHYIVRLRIGRGRDSNFYILQIAATAVKKNSNLSLINPLPRRYAGDPASRNALAADQERRHRMTNSRGKGSVLV